MTAALPVAPAAPPEPFGWLLLALPTALLLGFIVLNIQSIAFKTASERSIARQTQLAFVAVFAGAVALLGHVVLSGRTAVDLSAWYAPGYGLLAPALEVDLTRAILLVVFSGIIGLTARFSTTYMHREPGYDRFFLLLWLFTAGVTMVILASRIDLFFIGWEFVGLSSALLIGFFRNKGQPVRAGLRAWTTYRGCDVALLLGFVLLHHAAHSFDWHAVLTAGTRLEPGELRFVGALLIIGAMGKSAQAPLSGWLPRAMEGPTSSSALFYGGVSVHLGAFLLLAVMPILEADLGLRVAVGVIGGVTAILAGLTSRVRPDVKTAIGWSVASQLGVIWVEIALGLETLALVHIAAHAVYRTSELLTSPQALHDRFARESGAGGQLGFRHPIPFSPKGTMASWVHARALGAFGMEGLVARLFVRPFVALGRVLDRLDRGLSGDTAPEQPSEGSQPVEHAEVG